jgi:hypothetical protein
MSGDNEAVRAMQREMHSQWEQEGRFSGAIRLLLEQWRVRQVLFVCNNTHIHQMSENVLDVLGVLDTATEGVLGEAPPSDALTLVLLPLGYGNALISEQLAQHVKMLSDSGSKFLILLCASTSTYSKLFGGRFTTTPPSAIRSEGLLDEGWLPRTIVVPNLIFQASYSGQAARTLPRLLRFSSPKWSDQLALYTSSAVLFILFLLPVVITSQWYELISVHPLCC